MMKSKIHEMADLGHSTLQSAAALSSVSGIQASPIIQPMVNLGSMPTPQVDVTPKSPRQIEAPYGQGTIIFDAIIGAAKDDLLRKVDGRPVRWGNFTITFQAVKPQRFVT